MDPHQAPDTRDAATMPRRSGAADWLCLAAAPTFAAMALLSAFGGQADICAMQGVSILNGMALMYLLMSAFHLPPWLRLSARWSNVVRRT